jgi:hypothetical protein
VQKVPSSAKVPAEDEGTAAAVVMQRARNPIADRRSPDLHS